jgi:hypothetical protein
MILLGNESILIDLKPIIKRLSKVEGLIHHWSFNSHILDTVGGARLFNGHFASFTFDRFNRPMSALSIKNGSYQISPGNYFPTDQFSILAWVKPRAFNSQSRIIEFSNGPANDQITLMISPVNSNKSRFEISHQPNYHCLDMNDYLAINEWTHLSITVNSTINCMFVNGTLNICKPMISDKFRQINRNINYIGKSIWTGDENADAVFDEIKIFNKALSQQEVQAEMTD